MLSQQYAHDILDKLLITHSTQGDNSAEEAELLASYSVTINEETQQYDCINDFTSKMIDMQLETLLTDIQLTPTEGEGSEANPFSDLMKAQNYAKTQLKERLTKAWTEDHKLQAFKEISNNPPSLRAYRRQQSNDPITTLDYKLSIGGDNPALNGPYYKEGSTVKKYEHLLYNSNADIKTIQSDLNLPQYGWSYAKASVIDRVYPAASYLALFTTMPEADGQGYQEPSTTETDYQRVNLLEDFIKREQCLATAEQDTNETSPTYGATYITNKNQIVFPEIHKQAWGEIQGFGVFETKAGGQPILWGRFENDQTISGEQNKVPLFRVGNFKITLTD